MPWCLVQDSDKDKIFDFLTFVSGSFYPPLHSRVDLEKYSEKLAKDAINLFVTFDSQRVAHAAFYCNDFRRKIAFLSSISVRGEFQGSGVASFLVQKVIENCVKHGMQWIRLEVDQGNLKAVTFYEKHGFKFTEAGLMEKKLGSQNADATPRKP